MIYLSVPPLTDAVWLEYRLGGRLDAAEVVEHE
jgi:hypothetical protein